MLCLYLFKKRSQLKYSGGSEIQSFMVNYGNVERKEPGSSHFKIWSVSDSKLVLENGMEYVQCSRWESYLEMPESSSSLNICDTKLSPFPQGFFSALKGWCWSQELSNFSCIQQGGPLACLCFGFCFVETMVAGQVREWGYLVVFTDYLAVRAGLLGDGSPHRSYVTSLLVFRAKSRWGPWPGSGQDVSSLASGSQAQQHSTSFRPSAFASTLL